MRLSDPAKRSSLPSLEQATGWDGMPIDGLEGKTLGRVAGIHVDAEERRAALGADPARAARRLHGDPLRARRRGRRAPLGRLRARLDPRGAALSPVGVPDGAAGARALRPLGHRRDPGGPPRSPSRTRTRSPRSRRRTERPPGRSISERRAKPVATYVGRTGRGRDLMAKPFRSAELARDHHLLHLVGALADREDLGVAVEAADRVLLDVAVAAVDLDGLLGRADREPAGDQLRLRGGQRERLAARPSRAPRGR